MDTSKPSSTTDIENLEALLLALEGKQEDALAQMAGKVDPESLLRQLQILIEAKRYSEAADLVRGREPHVRWCEQAVAGLAAAGDFSEAERFVTWAHADNEPLLWPVCLVALARYRFLHGLGGTPEERPLLPGELSAAQQEIARRALADVSPIVAAVKVQKRLLTGIDASGVALAMEFSYALGDRDEAAVLAELLWARKPLPLNYAFAAIRKTIPTRPELPERLRTERGDSFEGKRLAAFIEGKLQGKTREAVEAALSMLDDYPSPDHQKQTAFLLLQLSEALSEGEAEVVRSRAEKLLGSDGPHAWLKDVESLVRQERFGEALEALEASPLPNHPGWLELMAAGRLGEGRHDDAVDLLVRATELLPEEGLLRKAAAIAAEYRRLPEAVQMMERLLRVDPYDIGILASLGSLLVRTGQYERAAKQYHILRSLEPGKPIFGLNEAACLARCLRLEDSLRVYDDLCTGETPPVEAVVGRGALLKAMNRAADGFLSLERHKAAFWDQPGFLKAYIDLGFAAKQEGEAHRGLFHLHQLQNEGIVGHELRAVGIQDLLGILRQERENEELLSPEILRGRFPWLLADLGGSGSAVAAVRQRTRTIEWLSEESVVRSRSTVYATNGYVVIDQGDGETSAEPIQSSEAGQSIVADLTSLITLHRLGLLGSTVDHFGKCLYSSDYGAASLHDRDRLVLHQPSRFEATKKILAAVDAGRILLAGCDGMPLVHEHRPDSQTPADEHSYAFTDLISSLKHAELLTDHLAAEIDAIAQHESGVTDGHGPLLQNDEVRIELSSLESLELRGLLGAVMSCFRVHVRQEDVTGLRKSVKAWEEQKDLLDQHSALWATIAADERFVPVPHIPPTEFREAAQSKKSDPDGKSWLPLFSAFIAEERGLPLLVDDRACQMLVHNTRPSTTAAFGTDALLVALLGSGRLSTDEAADAYLKLMRWRFRFFVVPASVMVSLAKRSLACPPGQPLRCIARYVQDCMRDPGLFGGPEPTAPPVTMAGKLFLAWTQAVSEFVVAIWEDCGVSEAAARSISEWALTECLPTPPLSSGPASRVFADLQARTLLSQAFVRSAMCRQTNRANGALTTIASVFGIGERDYLKTLAEVVDAF